VLIAGCGDTGLRVARRLLAAGCQVTGLVRSGRSAERLRKAGIAVCECDLDRSAPPGDCPAPAAIVYLVPPPPEGDADTRLQRLLGHLERCPAPRRIVYISTSAVYGDCGGAWITEEQPLNPTTPRGRRRLDAERRLQAWCGTHATRGVILRVPGIYGPGKLPLARLREGLPVLREAEAPWTNRIHADDLAAICVAALTAAEPGTIYNVSDGHPSNMTDYFFRVADAAGLPRPPVVDSAEAQRVLSPGMLSFLQDSRRMKNDRLLQELGITLQYPDLEAGLAACFEENS
jgi:nucleoside-diphosphate-sugar epimerase